MDEALGYFGKDWELVSHYVRTRTANQCQGYYFRHRRSPKPIDPNSKLKRACWSVGQKERLAELVKANVKDWDLLALFFPNKPLASIQAKYATCVLEGLANAFTEQEDQHLAHLLANVKLPDWKAVSRLMGHKYPPQVCKFRWHTIRRKGLTLT